MPKAVISDTSCFIILSNIGELDLLRKVYGQILTTFQVEKEFGQPLPSWVQVTEAKDKHLQLELEQELTSERRALSLWQWKSQIVSSFWMTTQQEKLQSN